MIGTRSILLCQHVLRVQVTKKRSLREMSTSSNDTNRLREQEVLDKKPLVMQLIVDSSLLKVSVSPIPLGTTVWLILFH